MIDFDKDIDNILELNKDPSFYREAYDELIFQTKTKRSSLNKNDYPNLYLEKHHILPVCCGGADEDNNFILFTYREHVIAHCLLWLSNQNNESLALAVQSMLLINNDMGRRYEDIDDLINYASFIKEQAINATVRSIACLHHESKEILKIYPSITSTSLDGFAPAAVGKAARNGEKATSSGYIWRFLEDLNEDSLINYNQKIEEGWIPNIKFDQEYANKISGKVREFIGFTEDLKFIKTYPRLIAVTEDGFDHKVISSIIEYSGDRDGFKYHKGYRWMLKEDFKKLYPGTGDTCSVLTPREDHYNIVCCDKNNKILKIYKNQADINNDGFNSHSLYDRITFLGVHDYCGYLWYKMPDWKDEKELERYRVEGPITPIPNGLTTTKKIIRYSIKNNLIEIEEIFNSITEAFTRYSELQEWGVHRAVYHKFRDGRPENLYKGYYWDLYDKFYESNKDLVEEFIKNPKENPETNFIDIDRRVVCCIPGTLNIVKIYDCATDAVSEGFSHVDRPLNGTDGYENKRTYNGYDWYKALDITDKSIIESYLQNPNNNKLIPIREIANRGIVSYILRNGIVTINKVYWSNKELSYDGFNYPTVNNKCKSGGKYQNYYWLSYEDFKSKYPNILEEYEKGIKYNDNAGGN